MRVLDIGSGWGGLALTLAEEWGADVTGITLSAEQLQEARARSLRAGLDTRVRFALQDWRDVELRYDRIVSVGMFEHVGPGQYEAFFRAVHRLLDERGVALLHTIGRFENAGSRSPWIEKHIFPGGYIPALSEIAPAIERSGLILSDVEVLRLHYAETLRAWRERFAARRDAARAMYGERFCRKWEFYLAGSEAGFREGSLVVFQLQLVKDRTVLPPTRDYIGAAERGRAAPVRAADRSALRG
jgi:cyclopropane-fatty-acyl-phospholipid synthase